MKVVFADPSRATLPFFFLKFEAQRTMKLLSPFCRGKESKMWCAFGHRHLASMTLTLSLSLVCLLLYGLVSLFPLSSQFCVEQECVSRIGFPWYSPKQNFWKGNLLFQGSNASLVWCPAGAFGGYPFGSVVSVVSFCMETTCPVR